MSEIHPIEQELINILKVEFKKGLTRQEQLKTIAKGLDLMAIDDFGKITDDAADWFELAAVAHRLKKPLPEFGETQLADGTTINGTVPEPKSDIVKGSEELGTQAGTEKVKLKKRPKIRDKHEVPHRAIQVDYSRVTGELDEFGCTKGTKIGMVNSMLVAGATMREINEAVGGRYYNHMKGLRAQGHLVEKLDDGRFRVTHKDKVGK